jgi:hypothetical protein
MFNKTNVTIEDRTTKLIANTTKINKFTHIKTYTPNMRPPKTTQKIVLFALDETNQPTI